MAGLDFDRIAEEITEEAYARALGFKKATAGSHKYHCARSHLHTNGDAKPSAEIKRRDGRLSAQCYVCGLKGTPVQVAADVWGLGLPEAAQRLAEEAGLIVSSAKAGDPGFTVKDYAEVKNLPVQFLQDVGVRSGKWRGKPCVEIPYRDAEGKTLCVRKRFAAVAKEGSRWPKGTNLALYGLDRLAEADRSKPLLLCEGESDCHTAWSYGYAALGVPGADAWNLAWATYLEGRDVCAWQEPDKGGETFIRSLEGIPRLRVIQAPKGVKDLSDLHLKHPDEFKDRLEKLIARAEPAGDVGSTQAAEPGTGKPVDGAELLEDLARWIRSYIWLPGDAADAIALWVVATWCVEEIYIAPILSVLSGTKQCGKTTLRDLLEYVVRRAAKTSGSGITSASLFRLNDIRRPTFLVDEADKLGGRNVNTELVGLLNDGYRKGATVYRCSPTTYKVQEFDAFGFRVLFAIDDLWDTVLDRSILVRLERKPRDANLRRFRGRTVEKEGRVLGGRIQEWTEGLLATIAEEEEQAPQPEWLSDRACDNWASMFAIASLAGEPWPERALHAAKTLSVPGGADGDANERLLRDAYDVFAEERFPEVVNSTDLAKKLNGLETSSWGDLRVGEGISLPMLAKRLGVFRVKPRQARTTKGLKVRGYWLEDLESVFRSYFPEARVGQPGQPGQPNKDAPSGCPTSNVGSGTSPVAKRDGHTLSRDKDLEPGQLRPHGDNVVPGVPVVPPSAPGQRPDAATSPPTAEVVAVQGAQGSNGAPLRGEGTLDLFASPTEPPERATCSEKGCATLAVTEGRCGPCWLTWNKRNKATRDSRAKEATEETAGGAT